MWEKEDTAMWLLMLQEPHGKSDEMHSVLGDQAPIVLRCQLELRIVSQPCIANLDRAHHIQAESSGDHRDARRKVLVQVEAHLSGCG